MRTSARACLRAAALPVLRIMPIAAGAQGTQISSCPFAGGQYAVRKPDDFFVQWLLGVQPPTWSAGVSDLRVGSAVPPQADRPMQPSFYDGPNEAPYVWW